MLLADFKIVLSCVQLRLLISTQLTYPSNDDQYSLTLDRHISQSTVGKESTNFPRDAIEHRSIHVSRAILYQLLINCQSSVNGDVNSVSILCQLSIH